jgi:hypothetical protein
MKLMLLARSDRSGDHHEIRQSHKDQAACFLSFFAIWGRTREEGMKIKGRHQDQGRRRGKGGGGGSEG